MNRGGARALRGRRGTGMLGRDETARRRDDPALDRGDGLLRGGGGARRVHHPRPRGGGPLRERGVPALLRGRRAPGRDRARGPAGPGRPRGGRRVGLGLVAVMLGSTLYAWLVVLPSAHAAREALRQAAPAAGAVSSESLAFARLHRLSSVLNGVSLVAGVLGLVAVGWRR